ncbi:MAG: tetratricopeptide repeat protein [Melioribacteraceae bacterium]|jgi:tetratricopeptide (TPR) repeat protein|nr:tetratricopeptide repeat protein [Melioribacteraceae bacterium]
MNIENEYKAIFELNNRTPLFARIAHDSMKNGDFEEAILILQKGIELFENYPKSYFLLGQALQKINRDEEADEFFQKGNSLLSDSSALDYYSSSGSDFIEIETEITENIDDTDSDELEELADKLKVAKIEINYEDVSPTIESNDEEFKPPKGLVSETLASIYFDQSNYKEAKAIYDTLVEIQPEREDYFKTKIFEIESRMKTQKSDI